MPSAWSRASTTEIPDAREAAELLIGFDESELRAIRERELGEDPA